MGTRSGINRTCPEVVQEYWAGCALNEKVGTRKRTKGVAAAGKDTTKRINESASASKNAAPKKRRT
jgi:hypothetical protein